MPAMAMGTQNRCALALFKGNTSSRPSSMTAAAYAGASENAPRNMFNNNDLDAST
jgi:hypothetical protein